MTKEVKIVKTEEKGKERKKLKDLPPSKVGKEKVMKFLVQNSTTLSLVAVVCIY